MRAPSPRRVRLTGAAMIAAIALAALPAAVAADDEVVPFFACLNGMDPDPEVTEDDGQWTVAAGEPIILRWGWQALRRGMVVSALKAIEQTVTVGGTAITDVDSYWSVPFTVEVEPYGTIWQADWVYDDVGSLTSGGPLVVTLEFYYRHPLFDGVTPIRPFPGPDAPVYIECEITVQ